MVECAGPLRKRTLCVCTTAVLVASTAPIPKAQTAGPRVIDVVARRFAFEPAEISVGVGEPVVLMVRSADGVHGLEIKRFKVKKEVPRGGEPVSIAFTASEAGSFPILCSEYCGQDHDKMKGTLVVTADTVERP
ncbi:MAG TPA: cupredoxin domain-containing protein [Vicinamibacterales bacterium]|nr:cupredoxin domain-containing protein [Vicinamibacterales bacterium]